MATTEFIYVTYIRTTPEELWEALTSSEFTKQYWAQLESDWRPGSSWKLTFADGRMADAGEVLESDPPRRLVQTFKALWSEDVEREGTSRVTWEITPVGTSSQLRVTHDQLGESANNELWGGWPMILSGLKTLIETGEDLDTPGSLMYASGGQGG